MENYKIKDFSVNTPKSEQKKLKKKLTSLKGVESVQLYPERQEISLNFTDKEGPAIEVLRSAVQRAGFTLSDKC